MQNLDIIPVGKCLEFGNVRQRAGDGSGVKYGGTDAVFEKITFCGEF